MRVIHEAERATEYLIKVHWKKIKKFVRLILVIGTPFKFSENRWTATRRCEKRYQIHVLIVLNSARWSQMAGIT